MLLTWRRQATKAVSFRTGGERRGNHNNSVVPERRKIWSDTASSTIFVFWAYTVYIFLGTARLAFFASVLASSVTTPLGSILFFASLLLRQTYARIRRRTAMMLIFLLLGSARNCSKVGGKKEKNVWIAVCGPGSSNQGGRKSSAHDALCLCFQSGRISFPPPLGVAGKALGGIGDRRRRE